ncbi:MAG: uracil-DNA glycosylase [Myxococcales bacterium]|nr:uracil-DNA glycosylase [Myxococcales bacterium]
MSSKQRPRRASGCATAASLDRLDTLDRLDAAVISCRLCPRLVRHREAMAREPRAAYRGQTYWARPLPGFGDAAARVLIVGLAPGAHGANRTGRVFTGDRSGDWLYRALHRAGFANQPESTAPDDNLTLTGARVLNLVRCAPPDNKPLPVERDRCRPFSVRELALLPSVRVLLALGGFAWHGSLRLLATEGSVITPRPRFGHGAETTVGPVTLVGCYHPSQQNTFTGRLTEAMLDRVVGRVAELARGAITNS